MWHRKAERETRGHNLARGDGAGWRQGPAKDCNRKTGRMKRMVQGGGRAGSGIHPVLSMKRFGLKKFGVKKERYQG